MRRRQWFFLGLLGTLIGMAVRIVRGRTREEPGPARWDPPARA
jgi:hypothetical protein